MSTYKGVKTLEVLEGADNYNSWIASKIRPYLKAPVLEVGAGIGNISEHFENYKNLTLTDVDISLVTQLSRRFSGKKNVHVEVFDVAAKINRVKNHFNTIYSVNVLEHIKNDEIALQNMNKLLNKGGRVIVLVPAKKSAFRKLDKYLGHYRRYEKEELKIKIENSGFSIVSIEYFNILGLLSWIVRDLIGGRHPHLNPTHVKAFDLVVPLLQLFEPKKNLPFGISLIAIAKKI